MPLSVVHTSAQSNEQTVRTFEYDKKPLTAVGVIAQHGADYEPHDSVVCVEWDTSSGRPICVERKSVPQMIVTVRGNLTRLTDFADAASRASPVSTSVEYDSKGNVLKILDDFGSGTEVTYGVEDRCVPAICSPPQGFSLPTAVVSGSLDPSSTLRTTSTFDYYFGPGLPKSVHDEDGRVSSYEYWQGDATWRVSSATAGEKVTGWAYNDDALATTMMVVDSANEIADSAIVQNDGIGRVRRITGNRGGSFKVDTEYNAVGRVVRRSNPYWQDVPIWTTWTFDGLGRPTTIRTPGNPVATYLAYDTLPSPTIAPASPLAGTTVYTTDPWGRKRWTQADSFGNLKYAVETVAPLSIESRLLNKLTQYQYDVFGRLRTITFDKQTRSFDYDGLGRLIGQALPERQAKLDATGLFGGQNGTRRYSDVFQYDVRSNLIAQIDARGARTSYDYDNDPLNRLHTISYDVPLAHDDSNPIVPVAPVTLMYKAASPSHLHSFNTDSWTINFDYDSNWSLSAQKTTFTDHPQQAFEFNLVYDSFGRSKSLQYPARYDVGGAAGARRTLGMIYAASALSSVTLDDHPLVGPVTYWPGGQVHSAPTFLPSGRVTDSFEFDSATGMPSIHKVVDAAGKLLFGQTFDFHIAGVGSGISGQMTAVRNLVKPELSQTFFYDPTGRLGQAAVGNIDATPYDTNTLWQDYSYDQYGNRSSLEAFRINALPCGIVGTPVCVWTPADAIELDGVAGLNYDESTNHIAGPDYKYDAAGNLVRAVTIVNGVSQSNTFVYDAAGRLVKVADQAGKTLEKFEYGVDRQRMRAISYPNVPLRNPRVVYYGWFGGLMLSESVSDLVVGPPKPISWSKDHFYAFGRRHYSESEGGLHFHINDSRGTGADLIPTSSGNTVSHRASLSFGTETSAWVSDDDDERFTTYNRSRATGLDYAVNRFYSASLGKFLQTDPLGSGAFRYADSQSLNAYAYAANDPMNRVDRNGLLDDPWGCGKFIWVEVNGEKFKSYFPACGGADAPASHDKGPQGTRGLAAGGGAGGGSGDSVSEKKGARGCGRNGYDGSLSGGNWSPFATLGKARETTALDRLAIGMLTAPVAVAGAAYAFGAAGIGSVATTAASRGLCLFGGSPITTINALGGEVVTFTGDIGSSAYSSIVNGAVMRNQAVNIISGVHGFVNGTVIADATLLAEDIGLFGSVRGVTIYNAVALSATQLTALLSGTGTTIGAFCNSNSVLGSWLP